MIPPVRAMEPCEPSLGERVEYSLITHGMTFAFYKSLNFSLLESLTHET
jgi:hypothetical protein